MINTRILKLEAISVKTLKQIEDGENAIAEAIKPLKELGFEVKLKEVEI